MKIAVSQVWHENPSDIQKEHGAFQYRLNHSYAAFLDRPNLLPLAVLPIENAMPADIIKNFDMLVLTGGGDPSPYLFGREDQGSRNPTPYRSTWDMQLYHAARESGIPILGICLGMQLMGIAEGGALIQDIPETDVQHEGSAGRSGGHSVTTSSGSILNSLLGDEIAVSSWHHQALEAVPPGYTISAKSNDGLIEGIESDDGRAIGVQWHPERDATGTRIIDYMVQMAGME